MCRVGLDEAEALFLQQGFLHMSTDELAHPLRCSKRTLYTIARCAKIFAAAMTRPSQGLGPRTV